MNNRLFVGNLNFKTSQEELSQHFSAAGTVVSATIVTDKFSGRSKGFGFVEMSSDEEAQNAISMLDGKEMDGRAISVSVARPREERPRQF